MFAFTETMLVGLAAVTFGLSFVGFGAFFLGCIALGVQTPPRRSTWASLKSVVNNKLFGLLFVGLGLGVPIILTLVNQSGWVMSWVATAGWTAHIWKMSIFTCIAFPWVVSIIEIGYFNGRRKKGDFGR